MNGNEQSHPARSVDFLSRLHDGELDASERARFEAHRARCSECRRAALEFEDALSLFRSTRSAPPRSDLAARILRKVQSTNRPRAPFPRRFQIDLGWAALLLTALFAVLITTPLLLRERRAALREGVVLFVTPGAPPSSAEPPAREALPEAPREKSRDGGLRHAAPPEFRQQAPDVGGAAVAPELEDHAEAGRAAPSDAEKRESQAAAAAPPQPAGGEGDVSARLSEPAAAMRFSVREVDGFGAPPALLSDARLELPPGERGREYLLVVDAQGTVQQVSRASSEDSAPPPAARDRRMARAEAATPPALSRLRFAPGNQPRRLLLRID
jgi:putative zinc finger protein